MRRSNLIALAVLLCVAETALAAKAVTLKPVPGSPDPKGIGAVATTYRWVPVWDEWGNVIDKILGASTAFQFSGLAPDSTYTLLGFSYVGDGVVTNPIAVIHTDQFGNAQGGDYSEFWWKYDYYELWTGNYFTDDRSLMKVVLRGGR